MFSRARVPASQGLAGGPIGRSSTWPRHSPYLSTSLATFAVSLFVFVFPGLISSAFAQGDANAGKPLYELKCAGCHGVKGDGKGPAAELLLPAPRDFTSGIYKIRTTANKTPTDQDIFKI